MGSRPGEHPRPAVVRSLGATYMEIHCTQICAFGAYCSLSVQSQRQRPCLENVSQCCYVSGLSRDAGSIGELRRRTGRSMHALRRAVANAFPSARFIEFARVVKFRRVCPSGKMQSNLPEWSSKTLPFVKAAHLWGKKPKSRRTATVQRPYPQRVAAGSSRRFETEFFSRRT